MYPKFFFPLVFLRVSADVEKPSGRRFRGILGIPAGGQRKSITFEGSSKFEIYPRDHARLSAARGATPTPAFVPEWACTKFIYAHGDLPNEFSSAV